MNAVSRALLELRQARPVIETSHYLSGSYDLVLGNGECAIISCTNPSLDSAFVDLLLGLRETTSGHAFCMGLEWSSLSSRRANALRGRVGRFTTQGAWVGLFSMEINILLQQMHHTTLPVHQLREEANGLCRLFGLPGLPVTRPDVMTIPDRRRAGLVRAFLARPPIIILESPLETDHPADADVVFQQITEARQRGAGVLCLTRQPHFWSRYQGRGVKNYNLYENGLEPIAGGE